MIRTIAWENDRVVMIDQRALPAREVFVTCRDHADVAEAIRNMTIRGAPAIGIAAAMGFALGFLRYGDVPPRERESVVGGIRDALAATRPTAANLFRSLERMTACFRSCRADDFPTTAKCLTEEALRVLREDIEANRAIGRHGNPLVPPGSTVLTHCNAGALATGGYGTALGIIRAANEARKLRGVIVDETRPLLQGARLTAWELLREGIPVTIITDSMAGCLMARSEIDLVIVGADRIAANGDTANKIGTYSLALLAREHGIPFYVAAPRSTIDPGTATGDAIPIEERDQSEVLAYGGAGTAPRGASARNPAFDVTPHRLITAIITEAGVLSQPFERAISGCFDAGAPTLEHLS